MKKNPVKIVFGLILLVSTSTVSAAFQVKDPRFAQCLAQLAQDKRWKTAEEVIEITCHSQKIQSVAGIEQFTNLTRLSLHNNQIVSIELGALIRLEHLNLARNNLSEIHLSDLPELTDVFLFRNKLTRITLNNLPKLKEINTNANRLTHFSYRNLPSVEKMYLFNNKLEHIDIHNLPSLQYMDARQNPMPDQLYEEMDILPGATILHDGNADDW